MFVPLLLCRTRNLRLKEAERKKNEFLKEVSVTTKRGGKKKIYSVNRNVSTEQDSVAPVGQEEESEVRFPTY